jgi:putative transposase
LVAQRNAVLLQRIRELKAEHPFWGYRRIRAYLHVVAHQAVHKQRGLRLLREHHLLVPANLQLKAKRTPMGSKPRPPKPDEWWGIDMTKVLVQGFGWIHMVVGLDWYTKIIVGYAAGRQGKAQAWLTALDMAVTRQFPAGVRDQGLSLMSANGCQPTSTSLMRTGGTLGIHQVCTSDNNPKGNADTERVMRTLKEECLGLRDWTCPVALIQALEAWIADDHAHYLHSALGYKPPRPFAREYHISHGTQLPAA